MIESTTDYSNRLLDLECLQTIDHPDTKSVEVFPGITNDTPKIVAGPQKLVQRYAVLFTTIIGSDVMRPGFGTTLLSKAISGNFGGYAEIEFLANSANMYAKERILEEDDDERFGNQPDDERLSDCWISDIDVDRIDRKIAIHASILTAAGEQVTFVVPTPAGIY